MPKSLSTDILIIGAGLAGLSAAVELQKAGKQVLVVDKGRGLGGRLAGRRIGDATFDHGAQFMTARDERFKAVVAEWIRLGVAAEWYSSYPGGEDCHPRYRGVPTMTAIAKHLAQDIDVMRTVRAVRLAQQGNHWHVELDTGDSVQAKALLITAPIPQTLDLLHSGAVPITEEMQTRLARITYESCIAVMAVLDQPSALAKPGAMAFSDGPIAWISENQQKGVSAVPAVTIHGSGSFSAAHFDQDRHAVGQQLIDAAQPLLGANVVEFQVQGWRYSKPDVVDSARCIVLSDNTTLPPLALAGDAFAGPRFEGAVLSGWAAAAALEPLI